MTEQAQTQTSDSEAPTNEEEAVRQPAWLRTVTSPLSLLAISAAVLIALPFVTSWPVKSDSPIRWDALLFFIVIPPALMIAVAIYLMAPLLAGLLVGYRFRHITVVAIRITYFNRHRIRIRLYNQWSTAWGWVVMCPKDEHLRLWCEMVIIAAGPIASLIGGLLILGLTPFIDFPSSYGGALIRSLGVGVGSLSLLLVLIVFLSRKNPLSAFENLRIIRQGGPPAQQRFALRLLRGVSFSDLRPRDWNTAWLGPATAETGNNSMTAAGCSYAYLWALDCGHISLAGDYLERLLALIDTAPPAYQTQRRLEAVYYEAFHRRDPAKARALFDSIGSQDGAKSSWRRAEAALLLAEGQYKAAREQALAGLKAIKREGQQDTALGEMEAEWFYAIITEADQGLAPAVETVTSEMKASVSDGH